MRRCGHNPTDIEVSDIINKIHNDTGSLDLQVCTEEYIMLIKDNTLAKCSLKWSWVRTFLFDNVTIIFFNVWKKQSFYSCVKLEIPWDTIRKCLREQKSNLVLNPIQLYQRQNIENATKQSEWTKSSIVLIFWGCGWCWETRLNSW